MTSKISNKLTQALAVAPLMAQQIQIKPKGSEWDKIVNQVTISSIISGAITLLLITVALVFFFILVLGGLKWVTSEGDEKKVGAARAQITNGLIGLAIVFAAFAILRLIDAIFGINILNGFQIPTFY
jgi:hypothetical protein